MHWSDCCKFTLCHRKVPKWKETVLSVASTLLSAHNLTMQCSVFYRCQLTVMRCSTFMHYTFKGFQGSRAKSWHKAKCPCFQEVLICAVTMAIKCYRHASKSYLQPFSDMHTFTLMWQQFSSVASIKCFCKSLICSPLYQSQATYHIDFSTSCIGR